MPHEAGHLYARPQDAQAHSPHSPQPTARCLPIPFMSWLALPLSMQHPPDSWKPAPNSASTWALAELKMSPFAVDLKASILPSWHSMHPQPEGPPQPTLSLSLDCCPCSSAPACMVCRMHRQSDDHQHAMPRESGKARTVKQRRGPPPGPLRCRGTWAGGHARVMHCEVVGSC